MPVYLVVLGKVKNSERLKEYSEAAGPTFKAFAGTVLARGKAIETLAGAATTDLALVAQFPDLHSARNWYSSPVYQALIPKRDAAMECTFVLFESPSDR